MKKNGDRAIAAVCFVLGILMFWFTRDFKFGGLEDFGTGFWPRVLAGLLMFCSALLFINETVNKDPEGEERIIDWTSEGMKRVYKVCGVLLVFCVLTHLIGLVPALVFLFLGVMLAMGERRPVWLLATSLGFPIFIYVVFQILLKVSLPTGIFF